MYVMTLDDCTEFWCMMHDAAVDQLDLATDCIPEDPYCLELARDCERTMELWSIYGQMPRECYSPDMDEDQFRCKPYVSNPNARTVGYEGAPADSWDPMLDDLDEGNEAFIREMAATELDLDDDQDWYVLTFPGTKMVQYIVPMGYFPDSEGPMDMVNKTPFISYEHAYRWAEACMYVGWYDREQKRIGALPRMKLPSWDEIFERFSI